MHGREGSHWLALWLAPNTLLQLCCQLGPLALQDTQCPCKKAAHSFTYNS